MQALPPPRPVQTGTNAFIHPAVLAQIIPSYDHIHYIGKETMGLITMPVNMLLIICWCLALLFSTRTAEASRRPVCTLTPFICPAPGLYRQHNGRRRTLNLYWGVFGGSSSKKINPGKGSGEDPAKVKARIASCRVCNKKGAVNCPVCAGTGIDQKNGAIFERYKCLKCQGFGYVSCEACNPGGLTPEQRGER